MTDTPETIESIAERSATEVAQKVAAQAAFDALIIESLRDIRAGIDRVEEKTDRNSGRMDTLIDTTNHRLDDFRIWMDAHATEVRTALLGKADRGELPQLVGAKLLNNKLVQRAIGAVITAIVGTAVVQHWWGDIVNFLTSF